MAIEWKRIGRALLAGLLLLAGCDSATGPERPLRVIFVGNSLTMWHDMPGMVRAMSEAAGRGRRLEVRSVAWNGMALRDHWEDSGTQFALTREGPWDVVFLQESALVSEAGRAYLREHVRLFQGKTSGEVALMMPWPPRPALEYFDDVHRAFRQVATETEATFVPAGEVWREAMRRDPALDLYDLDGGHPNETGGGGPAGPGGGAGAPGVRRGREVGDALSREGGRGSGRLAGREIPCVEIGILPYCARGCGPLSCGGEPFVPPAPEARP